MAGLLCMAWQLRDHSVNLKCGFFWLLVAFGSNDGIVAAAFEKEN
jgi:hypothetical protein